MCAVRPAYVANNYSVFVKISKVKNVKRYFTKVQDIKFELYKSKTLCGAYEASII